MSNITREEAIENIKLLMWTDNYPKDFADALRMAIEALSAPIVAKCYEIDDDHIYCSPEMADKIYRALHEDTNVQNMHRGEWIAHATAVGDKEYIEYSRCSECGEMALVRMNFCPNCGADMRGENNERK
jgi:hypothetical protein